MKNAQQIAATLGDAGLGAGYDAFGLDDFGMPDGNPMWGAFLGTGLGTITAIGVRRYTTKGQYAELIGGAAGVVSGGVMYALGMKSSGLTAVVSALLNNGLRALEQKLFAASPAVSGLRGVVIRPTQALGMTEIRPTEALMGPTADQGGMPQLVGANLRAAQDHITLVGGPQLAQQGGAWGATVIGGG
jgi:hypothetical protein